MSRSLALILPILLAVFGISGCGDAGTAPVATGNQIDQYLTENPDAAVDYEEEEELMEADDEDEI